MPIPTQVWLPELQLTLVRRATARLPRNTFVFRTAPKWTKPEIRQFLEKAYGVNVVRIATINYGPRYSMIGKLLRKRKAFKKVYVSVSDEKPAELPRVNYDNGMLERA